jgi:hypothetical protein
MILPLPRGEGRGEGKGDVRYLPALIISKHALICENIFRYAGSNLLSREFQDGGLL